jgi:hypothetical protein
LPSSSLQALEQQQLLWVGGETEAPALFREVAQILDFQPQPMRRAGRLLRLAKQHSEPPAATYQKLRCDHGNRALARQNQIFARGRP